MHPFQPAIVTMPHDFYMRPSLAWRKQCTLYGAAAIARNRGAGRGATRVLIEDMADGTTGSVEVPVTAFAGTLAGAHGHHLCSCASDNACFKPSVCCQSWAV